MLENFCFFNLSEIMDSSFLGGREKDIALPVKSDL